jgi:hypothetical protein
LFFCVDIDMIWSDVLILIKHYVVTIFHVYQMYLWLNITISE